MVCAALASLSMKGGTFMTIKKAIEIISSCDGNCKSCKHWQMKFSKVSEQITVYAHYCDIARKAGYVWYGERLATLKEGTLLMMQSEVNDNLRR